MTLPTHTPENIDIQNTVFKSPRNPKPHTMHSSPTLRDECFGGEPRLKEIEEIVRQAMLKSCKAGFESEIHIFVEKYMTQVRNLDIRFGHIVTEIGSSTLENKADLMAEVIKKRDELFSKAQTSIALNELTLDSKARAGVGQIMEESISPPALIVI